MPAKNALKTEFNALPTSIREAVRMSIIPPLRAYFRYVPVLSGKQFLWDRIVSHLWWLESNVLARTVFGSILKVNANDIVGRYIYYFGIWEPNLTHWIKSRLNSGDIFIDVGANVGYFSSLASKWVGSSGSIVAIEALPQTARILQGNMVLNAAQNFRIINAAAWDKEEEIELFTSAMATVGTTTVRPDWATQWNLTDRCKVPAKRLSELLSTDEIRRARLIKIDVEGAEWQVVSGMEKVFHNARPDLEIIIEVAPKILKKDGRTCEDLLGLFSKWGFFPYQILNDYSAKAYLSRASYPRPHRIQTIPTAADQADLIFSRINDREL